MKIKVLDAVNVCQAVRRASSDSIKCESSDMVELSKVCRKVQLKLVEHQKENKLSEADNKIMNGLRGKKLEALTDKDRAKLQPITAKILKMQQSEIEVDAEKLDGAKFEPLNLEACNVLENLQSVLY